MTEKRCDSAGKKKRKKERKMRKTSEDKAVDSGEEPKDKEKNGVKQKLNEIEGMTEIRSGLTEEESGSNGGREMTSVSESRGTGGRTGGIGGEYEERRDGKRRVRTKTRRLRRSTGAECDSLVNLTDSFFSVCRLHEARTP